MTKKYQRKIIDTSTPIWTKLSVACGCMRTYNARLYSFLSKFSKVPSTSNNYALFQVQLNFLNDHKYRYKAPANNDYDRKIIDFSIANNRRGLDETRRRGKKIRFLLHDFCNGFKTIVDNGDHRRNKTSVGGGIDGAGNKSHFSRFTSSVNVYGKILRMEK